MSQLFSKIFHLKLSNTRLFGTVYSFTAICNHRSERVMQKIGMTRRDFFNHPALPDGHRLKPHVLYILDLNGS